MASCNACGTTILFGGKKEGSYRFCNDKCLSNGQVLFVADQIPDDVLQKYAREIHQGPCPSCKGAGPVDVHMSHFIWSALVLTSWSSTPNLSCRSCGVKSQAIGATLSTLLGWWGFPWGIIMTPVQIIKNIFGMIKKPDPARPSAQLMQQARMMIATQAVKDGPRSVGPGQ